MDADITIIGAGIVGLAIASELADNAQNIYIIEKSGCHGMGVSSRNSEVIHAGIYYPPGSLKSSLCIEGRNLIYEVCSKHNLPFKKIGKLIIARTEDELEEIGGLMQNAIEAGVESLSFHDKHGIEKMEPAIIAAGAVFSPETGIVSAHSLMDYYLRTAKEKGAEIVCNTAVSELAVAGGGYRIGTINGLGEYFEFTSQMVINAAGLHADKIAGMIGSDYRHHFCKGDYFSINNAKKDIVRRLIYPVPEKNHVGLGVHLTLDLNGRMKLGPDASYIDRIEDYKVEPSKRDIFYAAAVRFLPFINKEDVLPDMCGIRPKLQGKNDGFHDFVISEDLPGFVNLIGIESPGLTAAPAIARHVKKLLTGTPVQIGNASLTTS